MTMIWLDLVLALCINPTSSFQIHVAAARRSTTIIPPLMPFLSDKRQWISPSAPSCTPTSSSSTALRSIKTNVSASIVTSKLLSTLPTCPTGNVFKLAATAGCLGLGAQLFLTALFAKSKSNPMLKKNPGYTAHTIVALCLMVLVSYVGIIGYYFDTKTASTAVSRVLTPLEQSKWLGAVICGMFVAWDIPTSLLVSKLRKPDVITHHVVMAIVAFVGATVMPMRYVLYYFGVAELSSIPLLVYDQLSLNCESVQESHQEGKSDDEKASSALERRRDRAKIITAVAFTLVRAFHFTKVTVMNFIPDVLSVLPTTTAVGTSRILKSLIFASVGFASLQLFWFSLIVRVILGGGRKEDGVASIAT